VSFGVEGSCRRRASGSPRRHRPVGLMGGPSESSGSALASNSRGIKAAGEGAAVPSVSFSSTQSKSEERADKRPGMSICGRRRSSSRTRTALVVYR